MTASKAIIEKEYQPRVIVSKTGPNPFNKLTDQDLDEYRREVELKQKGPEGNPHVCLHRIWYRWQTSLSSHPDKVLHINIMITYEFWKQKLKPTGLVFTNLIFTPVRVFFFFTKLHLLDKYSNILKYFLCEYIVNCIYFCDAQLYFQHHYSSLQCHMIFRNHNNMMLKKHFWSSSVLNTVVLPNIFVKTVMH